MSDCWETCSPLPCLILWCIGSIQVAANLHLSWTFHHPSGVSNSQPSYNHISHLPSLVSSISIGSFVSYALIFNFNRLILFHLWFHSVACIFVPFFSVILVVFVVHKEIVLLLSLVHHFGRFCLHWWFLKLPWVQFCFSILFWFGSVLFFQFCSYFSFICYL